MAGICPGLSREQTECSRQRAVLSCLGAEDRVYVQFRTNNVIFSSSLVTDALERQVLVTYVDTFINKSHLAFSTGIRAGNSISLFNLPAVQDRGKFKHGKTESNTHCCPQLKAKLVKLFVFP